jgi:hypothetical protein
MGPRFRFRNWRRSNKPPLDASVRTCRPGQRGGGVEIFWLSLGTLYRIYYVTIKVSCNKSEIPVIRIDAGPQAPPATFVGIERGCPALFVSNAPETIGEGGVVFQGGSTWSFGNQASKNLCRAIFSNIAGPGSRAFSRVRVFFWHVTDFNVPTWWGVFLTCPTNSQPLGLRGEVRVGNHGNLAEVGICFAEAQLVTPLLDLWQHSSNLTFPPDPFTRFVPSSQKFKEIGVSLLTMSHLPATTIIVLKRLTFVDFGQQRTLCSMDRHLSVD